MDRDVWIVSNWPPPVHGVSVFNAALTDVLRRRGIKYRAFRIGTRGALQEVEQFRAAKLVTDAKTLAQLWLTARRSRGVIYFTPSHSRLAVARDLAIARLARRYEIPLIAHLHGCAWLERWKDGGWLGRSMLEVLRQCRTVICLGPTFARKMTAATGLPCVGINNGVPAPPMTVPRVAAVPIELLYISNFIKSKGLWTAALAVRALTHSGINARLRCAGVWRNPGERDEFERDFADELRDGRIVFEGFADPAAKQLLLDRALLFLLPIQNPLEGQPLALIEAMANGVVPLTTLHGAIPDLFEFEGGERLAAAKHSDPAQLAESIRVLLANPEQLHQLSRACIERQREALTMDVCAAAVIRTLEAA